MNDFQEMLFDAGFESFSYSGRGMSGKECVAINIKGNEFQTIADILQKLSKIYLGEVDMFAEALAEARTDSLGKGKIMYFPTESWEDEPEDDCEDEEPDWVNSTPAYPEEDGFSNIER